MAYSSKEILFSQAAKAVDGQAPENSAPQSQDPEENSTEMLGPPPEDSIELIPQNAYYKLETSRAPRLSFEEQERLIQTFSENNPFPIPTKASLNETTGSASTKCGPKKT